VPTTYSRTASEQRVTEMFLQQINMNIKTNANIIVNYTKSAA